MTKSMKSTYLKIRITPDEMRELERQARAMGMSRSELARAMLSGDAPTPTPAPTSAGVDMDAIKAELRERMAELRGEITAAFDEILKKLTEIIRIPTFTEFRARRVAEGDASRPGETQLDYVTRIAKGYYDAYGIWPTPEDGAKFGRLDDDIKAKFPRHPPK